MATETETWSPRCPRCGGRARAEVTPQPHQIFAGRLRPDAMKPYVPGTRVRCSRCSIWFMIGAGTAWEKNPPRKTATPEPLPDDETGSTESGAQADDEIGESGGESRNP